jgi:hypothetical protein
VDLELGPQKGARGYIDAVETLVREVGGLESNNSTPTLALA